MGAAEGLFVYLLGNGAADDRRAAGEYLAGAFGHDRPVRHHGASSGASGDGADDGGNYGHLAEKLDLAVEVVGA